MFDPDIVDKNHTAQLAFKLLGESGICDEQILRFRERILSGDPTESDTVLIESIRNYRVQLGNIQTLQELGEKYKSKEIE